MLGTTVGDKAIVVDFEAGNVGGASLRDPIEKIRATLGPSAVSEATEELEGDTSKVYILFFAGHKVYKHWNASSWSDPIFVAKEGVRVGSSVKDFNRVYGEGQVQESEGPGTTVCYHPKPGHQFCITVPIGCQMTDNCTVSDIWVW